MSGCQWWVCEFGPRGSFGHFWDIFDCHDLMRGDFVTGIWWVEVRDAAETLKFTGQLPTTKNYLSPNIWSATVGKPWTWSRGRKPWICVLVPPLRTIKLRQNCLTSVHLTQFLLCRNTDNGSSSTNFWDSQHRSLWVNGCYNALFVYLWLQWVFVAACGLSLVAVSGGSSSLWCAGFSLWWLLLLQSKGSRAQAQ